MNRNDLEDRKYSEEDFVFFWRHTGDPVACFSQWYPCHFVVDGIQYNCAEQFMMAEKASIFNDKENWAEIMASDDPSVIKKLGRRVNNFDSSIWNSHCIDIVRKGNVAKFGQNPKLREILLSTGNKILVEASPYDRIWGIGLDAEDPDASRPDRWKGENRLGFILMEVRKVLRRQSREKECSIKDDLKGKPLLSRYSTCRFTGWDRLEERTKPATAKSWKTCPLDKFVRVPLDLTLSTLQMEVVSLGRIPSSMDDHWFMYCDENAIRYYRSWTGFCIFDAHYEKAGEEFHITDLKVNDNADQYEQNDVKASVALFQALLKSEFGGTMDNLDD